MGTLNVANRTLAVMDNYPFLRALNNECVDLIAIDPPFAANETFTSKPKPPISASEFEEEVALRRRTGRRTTKVSATHGSEISGLGITTFTRLGRCGFKTITRRFTR